MKEIKDLDKLRYNISWIRRFNTPAMLIFPNLYTIMKFLSKIQHVLFLNKYKTILKFIIKTRALK